MITFEMKCLKRYFLLLNGTFYFIITFYLIITFYYMVRYYLLSMQFQLLRERNPLMHVTIQMKTLQHTNCFGEMLLNFDFGHFGSDRVNKSTNFVSGCARNPLLFEMLATQANLMAQHFLQSRESGRGTGHYSYQVYTQTIQH